MICVNCGKEMDADAKFCPHCGELPSKPVESVERNTEAYTKQHIKVTETAEAQRKHKQKLDTSGAVRIIQDIGVSLFKGITVRTAGVIIIVCALVIGFVNIRAIPNALGILLMFACGIGAYLLDRSRTVFVSNSKVFHFSRRCGGGTNNVTTSNAAKARQNGIKPCPSCVKFGGVKRVAYKLLRYILGMGAGALVVVKTLEIVMDGGTGFAEKAVSFLVVTCLGGCIALSVSGEFLITDVIKAYRDRLLNRKPQSLDYGKVWIRQGTVKYHVSKTCAGGKPKRIDIREALDLGYDACGNCSR